MIASVAHGRAQTAVYHAYLSVLSMQLVQRLQFICRRENMSTDVRALSGTAAERAECCVHAPDVALMMLSGLADVLDCDVRACLNFLQFAHSKSGR